MLKRITALAIVLATILSFNIVCVLAADTDFPFEDVPATRWSNPYIVMLYNEGIVNGVSENLFSPAQNVTRAQFVKILGGVAGVTNYPSKHSFTDVVAHSWYEPFVSWAVDNGVTNGISNTMFDPNGLISRQDMATMIYRYVQTLGGLGIKLPQIIEPLSFTDENVISGYAMESVSAMQQAGIISGFSNNDGTYRFEPKGIATREQACKMLGELLLILRQPKAFGYLKNWVNDNYKFIDDDGNKCFSLTLGNDGNESGDYLYVVSYKNEEVISFARITEYSDGDRISTYLDLVPNGDGCQYWYFYDNLNSGENYITMRGVIDAEISENMNITYTELHGDFSNNSAAVNDAKFNTHADLLLFKDFGNKIFDEIGMDGYDMSCFGL